MLHGRSPGLLAMPLLLILVALGAGNAFAGWYGGLIGSPAWATTPAVLAGPAAAMAARDGALAAVTGCFSGLMGSVIGGWVALGEPMTFAYYRKRAAELRTARSSAHELITPLRAGRASRRTTAAHHGRAHPRRAAARGHTMGRRRTGTAHVGERGIRTTTGWPRDGSGAAAVSIASRRPRDSPADDEIEEFTDDSQRPRAPRSPHRRVTGRLPDDRRPAVASVLIALLEKAVSTVLLAGGAVLAFLVRTRPDLNPVKALLSRHVGRGPHNQFVHWLALRVPALSPDVELIIGIGLVFWALLFAAETVGVWFRLRGGSCS